MTPLDIEHATFERVPLGYRPAAVRAFLERLAAEREATLHEQRRLRDELAACQEKAATLREAEAELQRAVVAAERIAGAMKENARHTAQLIETQARAEAEALRRCATGDVAAAQAELARLEHSQSIVREQMRGQLTAFLRALDPLTPSARPSGDDDWAISDDDLPDA
ncbi:MAG: DivIVA domain-containing protein [bacterium]|nr:DivIVA domain-containing protein [bacterium]